MFFFLHPILYILIVFLLIPILLYWVVRFLVVKIFKSKLSAQSVNICTNIVSFSLMLVWVWHFFFILCLSMPVPGKSPAWSYSRYMREGFYPSILPTIIWCLIFIPVRLSYAFCVKYINSRKKNDNITMK